MAAGVNDALPVPAWLRSRVTVWQRRLKLDDWALRLLYKQRLRHKGTAAAAVTNWSPGYHEAVIEFAKDAYDEASAAEVDRCIVHELFHLVAAPLDDRLSDYVGTARVYDVYSRELETIADRFAILVTQAYHRKRNSSSSSNERDD